MDELALGAVDFVTKPSGPVSLDIGTVRAELVGKVRAAYASKARVAAGLSGTRERFQALVEKVAVEQPAPVIEPPGFGSVTDIRLIAIVASTGGPVALQHVLAGLPANLSAGLAIVLHIAPGFGPPLAARLDSLSQIDVRLAKDRESITSGVALLSPAGVHLAIERTNAGMEVRL